MKVLFWGSCVFCGGFLLHLLIWRIRLPEFQTKALMKVFGLSFLGWFVVCLALNSLGFSDLFSLPHESFEFVHIFVLVSVLIVAYIAFYTLLEVDSPSLLIIQAIASAGSNGLEKNTLESLLNDQILVVPRVNDLIHDNMATLENGRYRIAPKGARILRLVFWHRRLLGASVKGG